jgi:hypothetical protein
MRRYISSLALAALLGMTLADNSTASNSTFLDDEVTQVS